MLPSAKSFSVAHSKSHTPWGASIFDVLDTVSPPHTPEESQTATERQAGLSPLSPDGGTEECFYGPALPPELAHNSCAGNFFLLQVNLVIGDNSLSFRDVYQLTLLKY